MSGEKVSIKKIAELAGVSVATVSRIINQKGRFSKETEARVLKIMEEEDYVPNMLAKGLRMNRNMTIGIIVPDITGEFFAKVAREVQTRMFSYGYSSIICNTDRDPAMERQCLQILKSQQVAGLIHIFRNVHERDLTSDIPTIYIDTKPQYDYSQYEVAGIECDNRKGGYLAAEELLSKGCRRIGVMMNQGNYTHVNRFQGYLDALAAAGMPFEEELVRKVPQVSIEHAYRCMKAFWLKEKPDGMFCMNDSFAVGTLRAMNELQIPVPRQMKIVGYDSSDILAAANPPVTTIVQPVREIGELAVNLLLRMMEGERLEESNYVLPVTLLRREST